MGSTKEHIRFHTSVLCEGDVKFFLAGDDFIYAGYARDFYVVTFHRSSSDQTNFVRAEYCLGLQEMHENNCYTLFKLKVKVHKMKCLRLTNLFLRKFLNL
jgi:hypothetical protein